MFFQVRFPTCWPGAGAPGGKIIHFVRKLTEVSFHDVVVAYRVYASIAGVQFSLEALKASARKGLLYGCQKLHPFSIIDALQVVEEAGDSEGFKPLFRWVRSP